MEDKQIVDLFWAREEKALTETEQKYGSYCRTIAYNILQSREDSEECVNDTWLRAWNAIPPQRPNILQAFLGKITRNLSLDRYKLSHAAKRGGGQTAVALEELSQCVPSGADVEDAFALKELSRLLDDFLRTLSERECCIFLRRYWFVDSTADIAKRYNMPEGSVKSGLYRTRQKLRDYLGKAGVNV